MEASWPRVQMQAQACRLSGRSSEAQQLVEEQLRALQASKSDEAVSRRLEADMRLELAACLYDQGQRDRAIANAEAARAAYAQASENASAPGDGGRMRHSRGNVLVSSKLLARCFVELGRYSEALRLLEDALGRATQWNFAAEVPDLLSDLSVVYERVGMRKEALELRRRRVEQCGAGRGADAEAERQLACCAGRADDAARDTCKAVLHQACEVQNRRLEASARLALAEWYFAHKEHQAGWEFKKALHIFEVPPAPCRPAPRPAP